MRPTDIAGNERLPQLRHALPLRSEARWSDMLAVLVETDPSPLCDLVGLQVEATDLTVRREAAINRSSRPDLLVRDTGVTRVVIEVKVLAGLSYRQLSRYARDEPGAAHYLLIYPGRLPIDTTNYAPWHGITWEEILNSYLTSGISWIRATATAWLQHLEEAFPAVDGATVWNEFRDGEDFTIAMRTRMAWLHRNLPPHIDGIDHDLVGSSKGVSWIVRMFANAAVPGYQVMIELEERLPVNDYPGRVGSNSMMPIGPSIKVTLRQTNVITSAGFDWHYLHAMWPHMKAARADWVTNTARPRKLHDVSGWKSIVALGAPKYLGIGFGEAQTRINRACMFGARIQLAPTSTLELVLSELRALENLMHTMSAVKPTDGNATAG